VNTYRFYRNEAGWFIEDLPAYIQQGGTVADLEMVDGADTMLDIIAAGGDDVNLTISKEPFEGADILTLTEKCSPYVGGGYYLMEEFAGQKVNLKMWLCKVTEFVFGEIPEKIYLMKNASVNKVKSV
jgi:hypothetical protein